MSGFSSAHVAGGDWHSLCDRVLAEADANAAGDLAFVYVADALAADTDRIIDTLRERSGVAHWVGCVGNGLCGTGSESYEQAALSVLLTPLQSEDFRVLPGIDESADDWLAATRSWRERSLASVAVVHGDPTNPRLPELLTTVSDGLGGGFLIGGIAASETLPAHIADRVSGGGLSGVLFGGAVTLSTGLSQGCSLIGQRHRVTAGQSNVIERIDERPALDVFKEEIGEVLARDLRSVGGYIFAALPIAGSDTGDYLVRNLVGIDPEHGLVAIGDSVVAGMEIQFARRDAETARADLTRMAQDVRERLPGPPRAALYHSCLGRGRHQFGADSAELKLIRDVLGEVPLAGFYANGEISHNRLYGYTGVLTLFA